MATKLSFILDGKFFTKSGVKIPKDKATNTYFQRTYGKIAGTGNLTIMLLEDNGTFIYQTKGRKVIAVDALEDLLRVSITPEFIEMHQTLNNVVRVYYGEISIFIDHPEILNFLPITSEENVKDYLNFLKNTLGIDYNPGDPFELYVNATGHIIDKNGISATFDKLTCKYFDQITQRCFDIAGNKVYEWAYDYQFPKQQQNNQQIQTVGNLTPEIIKFLDAYDIETGLLNDIDYIVADLVDYCNYFKYLQFSDKTAEGIAIQYIRLKGLTPVKNNIEIPLYMDVLTQTFGLDVSLQNIDGKDLFVFVFDPTKFDSMGDLGDELRQNTDLSTRLVDEVDWEKGTFKLSSEIVNALDIDDKLFALQ